ncbi:MAG: hypothetical protein EZS28_043074 [Streblomastix strix]|uniref:Uncharacterized protein n=1 Tax=Streblomastix strix TaxID=222440 RepID=A0A5J4TU16_9EUKA|nr:MAG: hypothetical protein EZS28_043074 [Streblomastix strix]
MSYRLSEESNDFLQIIVRRHIEMMMNRLSQLCIQRKGLDGIPDRFARDYSELSNLANDFPNEFFQTSDNTHNYDIGTITPIEEKLPNSIFISVLRGLEAVQDTQIEQKEKDIQLDEHKEKKKKETNNLSIIQQQTQTNETILKQLNSTNIKNNQYGQTDISNIHKNISSESQRESIQVSIDDILALFMNNERLKRSKILQLALLQNRQKIQIDRLQVGEWGGEVERVRELYREHERQREDSYDAAVAEARSTLIKSSFKPLSVSHIAISSFGEMFPEPDAVTALRQQNQ